MQIDTAHLSTIRDAEYDPELGMLRVVIVCRPADLEYDVADDGVATFNSPVEADLQGVVDSLVLAKVVQAAGGKL